MAYKLAALIYGSRWILNIFSTFLVIAYLISILYFIQFLHVCMYICISILKHYIMHKKYFWYNIMFIIWRKIFIEIVKFFKFGFHGYLNMYIYALARRYWLFAQYLNLFIQQGILFNNLSKTISNYMISWMQKELIEKCKENENIFRFLKNIQKEKTPEDDLWYLEEVAFLKKMSFRLTKCNFITTNTVLHIWYLWLFLKYFNKFNYWQ